MWRGKRLQNLNEAVKQKQENKNEVLIIKIRIFQLHIRELLSTKKLS